MKNLTVEALARDEIREATNWYEEQSPGTGRRFILLLDALMHHIQENPGMFPIVRRAVLRRFPYGVYFRTESDVIRIIAVVHMHRHPDTWKNR